MNWLLLEAEKQLQEINEKSFDASIKGIVLFKHSTRCSISSMVQNWLENTWNDHPSILVYHLDLLKHRNLSNAIADDYGVEHQSPQILVIKNGKCVYHTSHSAISATTILAAINN